MFELMCFLGCLCSPDSDTIVVASLPSAPVLDGRLADAEYGAIASRITTPAGEVRIWVARHGGYVYVAARMPDTSFYWGDDFIVSLDANGSAGAAPQAGDRQWYLRRVLDSSVVSLGSGGRWNTPGQPHAMLGPSRGGDDWDVASTSTASGWSVELRIRESVLNAPTGRARMAFRTYNDNPRGWWSWPAAPAGTPPQRVERMPGSWAPLIIKR